MFWVPCSQMENEITVFRQIETNLIWKYDPIFTNGHLSKLSCCCKKPDDLYKQFLSTKRQTVIYSKMSCDSQAVSLTDC